MHTIEVLNDAALFVGFMAVVFQGGGVRIFVGVERIGFVATWSVMQ